MLRLHLPWMRNALRCSHRMVTKSWCQRLAYKIVAGSNRYSLCVYGCRGRGRGVGARALGLECDLSHASVFLSENGIDFM